MKRAGLLAACLTLSVPALAHDGVDHANKAEAQAHENATALPPPSGLPFNLDLGGAFELTDQTGASRSEADPEGRFQLLFFGYANCEAICSVALPLMADVADGTKANGVDITPVMVTIDPERDTLDILGPALQQHHEDFTGLTGTPEELQEVYDLFQIEKSVVFEDPSGAPVYAHGSFIYLLDAKGQFLTVLPPILSVDRMVEIVASYAAS